MKRSLLLYWMAGVVLLLLFLYFWLVTWHPACFIRFTYNKNLLHLSRTASQNTVPQPAIPKAFSIPSNQLPNRKAFKENWKGDCSYPSYISEKVQQQPWFPRYLYHLQRVNLSTSSKARRHKNCARWWYSTPQYTYDELPHRQIGWKLISPVSNITTPKCTGFGQEIVQPSRCSAVHVVLWRHLEKLGVVYFPTSGTELGVLRGSSYLNDDGDIDIFVDMPQARLIQELSKVLLPPPYTSGNIEAIKAETHWYVSGCPNVHLVFNDWIADEMGAEFRRPSHEVTCECMLNSIKIMCHKKARYRMYIRYGPSWRVPLHAKQLDMPWIARDYNIANKLKKMASEDGIVYEQAVRALDNTVKYEAEEMEMILAQLNVLKELIAYQLETKKYDFV